MENALQTAIFPGFFQFYMVRLIEVLSFKIKKIRTKEDQKSGKSETR